VRSPDRTPSSRPCPIWRIRSLPTLTHCFPRSYGSPPRTADHSHCPVLAPATLAALPSTRTIPDRTCSTSLIPFAPFARRPLRMGWTNGEESNKLNRSAHQHR
jgi:hypothetical protein